MKSITQLGQLAKSENRALAHMSDAEAGRWIRHQNPGKFDDYTDDDTLMKVNQLMDMYQTDTGIFSNWWKRLKAESGQKLLTVVGQNQLQVLQQASTLAAAVEAGQRKQIELEMFLAQHQYQLFKLKVDMELTQNALEEGLTLQNHQQQKMDRHNFGIMKDTKLLDHDLAIDVRTLEHEFDIVKLKLSSKLEIKRMKQELKNNIKTLEAMSRLKISESKEVGSTELNFRLEEWAEKVRLAIIAKDTKMGDNQKRVMVQGLIDECYRQIEDIRTNVIYLPETKTRMIEDREDMIAFFKGTTRELLLR